MKLFVIYREHSSHVSKDYIHNPQPTSARNPIPKRPICDVSDSLSIPAMFLPKSQTLTKVPSQDHHHRLTTNHAPKTCNTKTIPTTLPFPRLAPASITSAVPHRACAVVGRLSPLAISVVQNPPCCITVVVGLFTTIAPPPLYAVVVAAGATYWDVEW